MTLEDVVVLGKRLVRFVSAMIAFCFAVGDGTAPGPYTDARAERFARLLLIDDKEFRALDAERFDDLLIAGHFGVLVEQVDEMRHDLRARRRGESGRTPAGTPGTDGSRPNPTSVDKARCPAEARRVACIAKQLLGRILALTDTHCSEIGAVWVEMTVIDLSIDSARWFVLLVFALAAAEKTLTLRVHSEAWHPVMLLRESTRRHARPLLAVALALDLVAVAGLALAPLAGAAVAACAIGLYTGVALPLHASGARTECRCFWRALNATTRRGLLVRNGALLAAAVAAGAAGAHQPSLPGAAAGAALIALLSLAVRRLERERPTAVAPAVTEPHGHIQIIHSGGGSQT